MKKNPNFKPTNPLANALLTDLYQLTMAYGYWDSGRHEDPAVFDLFFRRCPFGGEFAVLAGIEETLRYVNNFHFTERNIDYLKLIMPECKSEFFSWLRKVDFTKLKIYAQKEGSIVFPRVPLLRVEGPLALAQMLETPALNLINYATLIATNAARFRLAAGKDKMLLEFGLRRAQGPDGAISASRYSYIGGFDGTSNVLAGELFGIPSSGTMAHSYAQSFTSLSDLKKETITDSAGKAHNFVKMVLEIRKELGYYEKANEGELAAFISYAQAFPTKFLALVDTYNTLESGVPNFICVAIALARLGHKPIGVRIDSGDLADLSKKIRRMLQTPGQRYGIDLFKQQIVASNDINEKILSSLNEQGHEINAFGIGTNLVTCEAQPALGGVYKLVEVNGKPRIKLSEDAGKMTIPGRKTVYRLYGQDEKPILDLMVHVGELAPAAGKKILCRHPFIETKRVYVTPTKVERLHHIMWYEGKLLERLPTLKETRDYVKAQIENMREDHLRTVNPTPYKVSVSERLYGFIHELLDKEAPVKEIS
ncbi:MAG: nicotinate phosphoribosyltransferase [bacterium]|nr:nicotinate phosphoribosyltransferase [bacterium]